jgi:glycosyltransferase involved in cell wall biosynthesis
MTRPARFSFREEIAQIHCPATAIAHSLYRAFLTAKMRPASCPRRRQAAQVHLLFRDRESIALAVGFVRGQYASRGLDAKETASVRICLYTEMALPKIGGHEMAVDGLARQFLKLGHEVKVLAPRPRLPLWPRDHELPYPVVRHPRFFSSRWFVGWYRQFLLNLHRKWPFEIVHCQGIYPPGWLAGQCKTMIGTPLVITSQGGDVYERSTRLAKSIVRRRSTEALQAADALVSISSFTRDGFLRLYPGAKRIADIPNGADLAEFDSPAPAPADLPADVKTGEYAVFLGRLKNRKGVDVLLRALAILPPRRGVELVIVGDGEERQSLNALCSDLQLNQRVRFVGSRSGTDKIYYLQNALFGIVPTRTWEGLPLVVPEQFAAGLAVLATDVPGLGAMIRHGETGLVVPPESSDALARAMQYLFADARRTRAMGAEAGKEAERFHWKTIAMQHLDLYSELCRAIPFKRKQA